ncbi:MAG: STAS domain-containing protein [Puniceicoccales bacterium]|jgi:SulP family sulfate permease|nr:STAS domain-containing protein [Puniceicoccales bacterium]
MIAILEAARAGLLHPRHWQENLLSGLVVGVIAIPLSMAFAIASGVEPVQGLHTAIIASLCVALFGGCRVQVTGPTSAFVVVLASIHARYGVEGLQLSCFMAGVILLLMGFLHLGTIIKFVPDPVIIGFTSGLAIVMWVGQWKEFFGLDMPTVVCHFHERLGLILRAFPTLDPASTMVGLASLVLMAYSGKYLKKIPAPLVALCFGIGLQSVFHFEHVRTIGSVFGGIPQTWPKLGLSPISFAHGLELIGPAFAVALLGAIESLLAATVIDGMRGTRHDSNQELIGQGIANMASPLFGGIAATGSIARSIAGIRAGGNSPLMAIVHALALVLMIVYLAPLAQYIPLATLSAILFVVAYNMSDIPRFWFSMRHLPKSDNCVLFLTFFLTIFSDLVVAVNIGVLLSTFIFMTRMSRLFCLQGYASEAPENLPNHEHLPEGMMVYEIHGPFFFGAVETFERTMKSVRADIRLLVLRLKDVPFIDATGLQALRKAIRFCAERRVRVILCEGDEKVGKKIRRASIEDTVQNQALFLSFPDTVALVESLESKEKPLVDKSSIA